VEGVCDTQTRRPLLDVAGIHSQVVELVTRSRRNDHPILTLTRYQQPRSIPLYLIKLLPVTHLFQYDDHHLPHVSGTILNVPTNQFKPAEAHTNRGLLGGWRSLLPGSECTILSPQILLPTTRGDGLVDRKFGSHVCAQRRTTGFVPNP